MKPTVACIILASGHSTRFGSNKLLAQLQGQPLIQYIITKIKALQLPFIVVTRFLEVTDLCQKLHAPVLQHNELYQNDTIRLGLTALSTDHSTLTELNIFPYSSEKYNGYMFCTGDQPLLELATLQKLVTAFQQQPHYIHRLSYHGTPGNPVIFPAKYFEQLLSLPQDCGGSYIIKQYLNEIHYVEASSVEELCDIDTPEELMVHEAQHSIY